MPQDLLQIAIEHHRSGRFRQAQEGYRAILRQDPQNAQALMLLGVLAQQSGRTDEALPLLSQAAMLRPEDGSIWHNLAQTHLIAGHAEQAVSAFEKAVTIQPARPESWLGLAMALLKRKKERDTDAAVGALGRAQKAGLDSADLHYARSVALLAAGRANDAVTAARESLAKDPDFAMAWYQQGLSHAAAGNAAEARKCLLKSAELKPDLGPAWCALARLDEEAGRLSVAQAVYRRAIRLDPAHVPAYDALGHLLERMGNHREAMDLFMQAARIAHGQPKDSPNGSLSDAIGALEDRLADPRAAEFHYAMAAQTNLFPPSRIPAPILARHYDQYADRFDSHLRDRLEYRGPELITQAVKEIQPPEPLDILDLGCGTGLCGLHLRPLARNLWGVDLSAGMIEKAKERKVYDHLEVSELVEAMRHCPTSFDLVVAGDVLIYIGDLAPVFEAAARVLRPSGLLVFTVEAGEGDRFEFSQKTRRFTHSAAYLRHLASIHGFTELFLRDIVVRSEALQPVRSFLVALSAAKPEGATA